MTIESVRPPASELEANQPSTGRLDVWAARLFVLYLVVAFPLLLLVFGSYHWFFGDEWEFLADRSLALNDIFRDHFGHWATTPVLIYRGLYNLVGVRSYLPYQALLVLSHLLIAWLLFVVIRRAGVKAWIGACVVAPFVIFGPGAQNLTWAFQIAFNFALLFGLVQLLLADHDGPVDRRDWLGLAAGGVALTCSGVGPAMVVAVGAATLIRRGMGPAAFQTVPLFGLFGLWYVLADPSSSNQSSTLSGMLSWVGESAVAVAEGLGRWTLVSAALAGLLVVGSWLTWVTSTGLVRRRWFAAPMGLLVGALAFVVASGATRATGIGPGADSSRYVYVVAALSLPAFAVAAHSVVARWRMLGPVVAGVFLLPVVPNFDGFEATAFGERYFDLRRDLFAAMAYSPYVDQVPSWVEPLPGVFEFYEMDVGFLRSARRDGRLPARPDLIDPAIEAQMPIRFGLATVGVSSGFGPTCVTHEQPLPIQPALGDRLTLATPVNVATADRDARRGRAVNFRPSDVEVVLPELDLMLTPAPGAMRFVVCDR